MLIPQFTLRNLLIGMIPAAMAAWIIAQAFRGAVWAECFGWTILFAVFLFALHAGAFGLATMFSRRMQTTFSKNIPTSPFAQPVSSPFESNAE